MNLISLSLKTVGTKYVSKSILLPDKQRYQKSYGYTTSRNNGVFKVWRHFCSLSSICILLYCRQRESARGDDDERPGFGNVSLKIVLLSFPVLIKNLDVKYIRIIKDIKLP